MAATPVVDTRSSEVSFNFTTETLNSSSTRALLSGHVPGDPGRQREPKPWSVPPAGGDRQDNTYLMDGANITNPGFGHLGTEVNELDIAEVNLKRAGISAEFGRTGRHRHQRGQPQRYESVFGNRPRSTGYLRIWSARMRCRTTLLGAGVKPGTFRDSLLTTETGPAVGVGGPVIKDHIFFYGSARYSRQKKWDRVNKVGTVLPDELRTGPEFYGKLTATPEPPHQLIIQLSRAAQQRSGSRARLELCAERRDDDRQRQPDCDRRMGAFHAEPLVQRAIPLHERDQRRRAGDRSRIPAAVQSQQPDGDGPDTPIPIRPTSTIGRQPVHRTSRTTVATKSAARSVSSSDLARTSHALKAGRRLRVR